MKEKNNKLKCEWCRTAPILSSAFYNNNNNNNNACLRHFNVAFCWYMQNAVHSQQDNNHAYHGIHIIPGSICWVDLSFHRLSSCWSLFACCVRLFSFHFQNENMQTRNTFCHERAFRIHINVTEKHWHWSLEQEYSCTITTISNRTECSSSCRKCVAYQCFDDYWLELNNK